MHIALWAALAMTAHSSQGNRKDMHIPYMGSISATRIGVHVAQTFVEENPSTENVGQRPWPWPWWVPWGREAPPQCTSV